MLSKVNFRIKTIYNILRPSEKKVADYILNYCGKLEDLSMTLLAKEVAVSQPTVMRFVKAIGYDSFKQFKLENYQKTVALINQSQHISIYAVENSMGVAHDLMTKLIYLGKSVTCHSDYYLQSIDASNLTRDSLAIGISYSGNSKNTVEVLKIAKDAGAQTIAIVNFENTMLTRYGDIVLSTSNDQFLYGDAIFSRTAQIALVDMIYMGVIISDYDNYTKKLDHYSRLIKHRGYQKEEL